MVVWRRRGGKGISARHWMFVWRWRGGDVSARHLMVVWRGGKGVLVPGIGWLCGGEVSGD